MIILWSTYKANVRIDYLQHAPSIRAKINMVIFVSYTGMFANKNYRGAKLS